MGKNVFSWELTLLRTLGSGRLFVDVQAFLIHGEVTDSDVDVFDREEVFIDKELSQITKRFPKLKIVLEHITTSYAVNFVQENNIGATITPHHLHINRNAMFFGCLLYTSPSPRDRSLSRMPSSA